MTGPPLNDATFRLLRDLVYEKCGIYVPDTKKYFIENRLAKRVQETNLGTFEEYLRYLQVNGKGETDQLFRVVTTNETYFFREPQQFEAFTAHVVPGVLGRKPAPEIRIWSAACSTGEEPYTVAAILRESAPGVRADILGSDISDGVLESAR